MKRTYISELQPEVPCKIAGFLEAIRSQKTMQFLILKDVTGRVQITIERAKLPEIATEVEKLTPHSFITMEGACKSAPQVKIGGIEFIPTRLTIDSIAEPLPINEQSLQDKRLNYRWIDLRDEQKTFYFKMQTSFEKYVIEYFTSHGYIEIHTPKITALSSEGGSEVFEIKNYFGQKAYLTQSPQLYKQMSMMAGFDKTFEIGEYFRANPSFTSRHDTEFTCFDVEISFIESHHNIMDAEEELLTYVLAKMKEELNDEYKKYFKKDMPTITYKIPRIPISEVYTICKEKMGYAVPRALKGDLDPESERLICEYAKKELGSDFVFVTDFPASARAFYSKRHEDNEELTKTYDLLFNGCEITSGAQREHRHAVLKEQIRESGIDPETMSGYLEFFRYGAPTHGGFALGITRVLFRLFDLPSVKDVTFLFRGPDRLLP